MAPGGGPRPPPPGQRLSGPLQHLCPAQGKHLPAASAGAERGRAAGGAAPPNPRLCLHPAGDLTGGSPGPGSRSAPPASVSPTVSGDLDSRSGSQGCAGAKQEPQLLSGNSNNVTPACILGGSESLCHAGSGTPRGCGCTPRGRANASQPRGHRVARSSGPSLPVGSRLQEARAPPRPGPAVPSRII